MSAEQIKVAVHHPKVERSSRELAAAFDRRFAAEDEHTELALAIACEDPTERDHLASNVGRARARVKAAFNELVRAFFALVLAWLAQRRLDRCYRKITAIRGDVGRAERSALALEKLLGGFFIRRVVGAKRLLRALGANSRTDDEGNTTYSLKVAERSYRAGDGFGAGLGYAADLPVIRVFLGVRVGADGVPVWCLKRFVRDEARAPSEVHNGSTEDADDALLYFYMEPSHQRPADGAAPVAQGLEPARHRQPAAA